MVESVMVLHHLFDTRLSQRTLGSNADVVLVSSTASTAPN